MQKARSIFILGHLSGVLLDDLFADSGETMRLSYGDAAPQIEQGVRQRLQNDFVTLAYEGDAIAFLQVQ